MTDEEIKAMTEQELRARLKDRNWELLKCRIRLVLWYFLGFCMCYDLICHLRNLFCGH